MFPLYLYLPHLCASLYKRALYLECLENERIGKIARERAVIGRSLLILKFYAGICMVVFSNLSDLFGVCEKLINFGRQVCRDLGTPRKLFVVKYATSITRNFRCVSYDWKTYDFFVKRSGLSSLSIFSFSLF